MNPFTKQGRAIPGEVTKQNHIPLEQRAKPLQIVLEVLFNKLECFIRFENDNTLPSLLNVFKNDVQCGSNYSNDFKQISTCIFLLIVLKF